MAIPFRVDFEHPEVLTEKEHRLISFMLSSMLEIASNAYRWGVGKHPDEATRFEMMEIMIATLRETFPEAGPSLHIEKDD